MKGVGEVKLECPDCGEEVAVEIRVSEPDRTLHPVSLDGAKDVYVGVSWDPPEHTCPDGPERNAA